MTNLLDTTFITAIKIESHDRYRNAKTVLKYLNEHFQTNVFIYETSESGETKLDFLDELKNLNIILTMDTTSKEFHRTRFLNYMLGQVKTKIVCNYDIDVIFGVPTYVDCQNLLLNTDIDIIYPYPCGDGQIRVYQSFDRKDFEENFDIKTIDDSPHKDRHYSYCGHAFFAKTERYKELGGENENFISYGPEDRERLQRFTILGAKIERLNDRFVYHFEHSRGNDSGGSNPNFGKNNDEFEKVIRMTAGEMRQHVPSRCNL